MPRRPTPTQGALLRDAMNRRGWVVDDLRDQLELLGHKFTRQAVFAWLRGGGIKDPAREALMDLLKLDGEQWVRACARRYLDTPPSRRRYYNNKNLPRGKSGEVHQESSTDGSTKAE